MEPLDSNYLTSKRDIIDSENIECQTPSPLETCTGSDCSVSTIKIVYDAKTVVEKCNDEILRIMGRSIEVSNEPEEGSASGSESSIVSSASTLKSRLHNLPPSSEAVKLANRVTALNERIRRERDLYLHLQGLDNRIEEKDEGELSTTDSSKTVNSTFKNRHHGHFNNARARRRERLNSSSAILQHEITSNLQLCSPGFSSPEPLTLREIHEDWIEGMDQLPSPIKHRYSFRDENLATAQSSSSITQDFEIADEVPSSCQNASQFSKPSYRNRELCPVSSDCENSTPLDLKDGMGNYNELSSETQNANFQATTMSSTSLDYPYVTRKRAPLKFGGYRSPSGLVLRNLSSDSESDAASNRIMNRELRRQKYPQGNGAVLEPRDAKRQGLQHTADFTVNRFTSGPDRIAEIKPYSVEKMEVLEGRPLSPVVSIDSRQFFDNSNLSQGSKSNSELQVPEESGWAPIPLNEKSHLLNSDFGNVVKQNAIMDNNADNRHITQLKEGRFSGTFNEDKEAYISKLRGKNKSDENFFRPVCPISLSEQSQNGILPSLQSLHISNPARETKTLILRKETRPWSQGPENVHPMIPKSDTKTCGITNHHSLPASVRSLPEGIENPDNLRDGYRNHSYTVGDDNIHPKIPPLEIHSHDPSQSHSLSSEERGDDTARSSLDVNALIQALSDVSLKQNASRNDKALSSIGLKSPLGYGNRFSGSSCPRSSEYTPGVGGSRQSLTSLEANETHSVRISKEESTAPGEATSSLKSNEPTTRSGSTTPAVSKNLEKSAPLTTLKRSSIVKSIPLAEPKLEIDLFRESSLIPVEAKVNRTNLVCPKHPMKIKSVRKLISPRKYRSTDMKEEVSDPLTTRTNVSQSSDGTRKSFRSLKSAQLVTKVPRKKTDGLKSKTDSTRLPAPLSAGRRVLEPLKTCPKIKLDLLTNMSQKLERRKKIANDLSEIINSQSEDSCERTMNAVSSRNTNRSRRLSRTNKTDSRLPCLPQHREDSIDEQNRSTINDSRISSGIRTPEKPFDINSRPSTEEDQVIENAVNDQKYFGVPDERRSITPSNALYLRSDRLSMSSGDYEEKKSWSPSPRDKTSTKNEKIYDSEDKIDDQHQPVRHTNRETMFEVMNLDAQEIRLSNVTGDRHTKSFKNCVHLDDLQGGKEVALTGGLSECREADFRKIELFNRLPDEISGSLTRRVSHGTQVEANLNLTNETPFTIEELRRNIQENNDRWIKGFMSDEDLENSVPRSTSDKISSADSNERNQKLQSPLLLPNMTKSSEEISNIDRGGSRVQKTAEGTEGSCSRNSTPGKIGPRRSDNRGTSLLHKYKNTRQESECNGQPGRLDSQRSSMIHSGTDSQQNTFRSLANSTDSTTVSEFNETHECEMREGNPAPKITEPNTIESDNFKEEQARIANTAKDEISPADSPQALFSIHPAEFDSKADKPDRKVLNLSTDTKIHPDDDDVGVVEALLPKKAELDSTSNRPLEYSQSKLNNLEMSDEDCKKSEEEKCHPESHSRNELEDHEPSKMSSPSCTRSAKSQTLTQHHKNTISSPVSIKSFLSMSKLNSSPDSKWEAKVMPGVNIVKKSQDRFPFTISESGTRKTSKFKVVADVNLDQLMQDQNAHAERNDAFLSQKLIPAKSGDQRMMTTNTIDTEKRIDCSDESPVRQLTPFLEEFRNRMSDDSPDNWDTRILFNGSNYISYGCREEPKALMPSVKEMVKKISAKLGYARRKRCLDPEETKIEILYRNKKCRYESGEGSSSAASLYQSQQLFNTNRKLVSSFVRRSTGSSKASSVKKMTPKRNHEHISMFMQHSPRKGCDQNDLWIQEFDSDVEFNSQVGYCRMQNDLKREIMPRTSSPVNDPYSMFMARSKSSGVINRTDHNDERSKINFVSNFCDDGDNENVNSNKKSGIDDNFSIKVPEMVLKSPRTPANSLNDSTNEFKIHTEDENFEDSIARRGCCCFNIYHFFVERSSKKRKGMKISKRKVKNSHNNKSRKSTI